MATVHLIGFFYALLGLLLTANQLVGRQHKITKLFEYITKTVLQQLHEEIMLLAASNRLIIFEQLLSWRTVVYAICRDDPEKKMAATLKVHK